MIKNVLRDGKYSFWIYQLVVYILFWPYAESEEFCFHLHWFSSVFVSGLKKGRVTEQVDLLVVLLAAAIHDIGHPGTNNVPRLLNVIVRY